MTKDLMKERRKALEEAFFTKQNAKLLDAIRKERSDKNKKVLLCDASGISDEAVLDQLVAVDIAAEEFAALTLIPLVHVAWADHDVHAAERKAILAAAESTGVAKGSAAHELLETWLDERPGRELFAAWTAYAKALPGNAKKVLQATISARATEVARAAGGVLGIGSLSDAERAALTEIEQAFA